MIEPSIGRVVWYQQAPEDVVEGKMALSDQKLSAMIAYVWEDGTVNLAINDANGVQHGKTSVPLFQGEAEDCPFGSCCWMPYQKQQAEKHSK